VVGIAEVYAAGEDPIPGLSRDDLVAASSATATGVRARLSDLENGRRICRRWPGGTGRGRATWWSASAPALHPVFGLGGLVLAVLMISRTLGATMHAPESSVGKA
jgi:hypothetical protein